MARLTSKRRKALPKSSFALKGKSKKSKGGKGGKGRYPIDTKARARNALSRVSQFGSASEKARVRAAVHRKYPSIGKKSKRK